MSVMAAAERAPTTPAAAAAVERLHPDVVEALPTLVELLDRTVRDDEWLPWAACRGMDQRGFYPNGPARTPQVMRARATCEVCPVRWECLADILRWEPRSHRFGIWGGLNGRERAVLARVLR